METRGAVAILELTVVMGLRVDHNPASSQAWPWGRLSEKLEVCGGVCKGSASSLHVGLAAVWENKCKKPAVSVAWVESLGMALVVAVGQLGLPQLLACCLLLGKDIAGSVPHSKRCFA